MFTKHKVHSIGGPHVFWSLPILQSVKTRGISCKNPMNPFQAKNDTSISQFLACVFLFVNECFHIYLWFWQMQLECLNLVWLLCCRVTAHIDSFLHADGMERQIIKDTDVNMPLPKIRACSISDPLCRSSEKMIPLVCLLANGERKD